jgi:hexokinase
MLIEKLMSGLYMGDCARRLLLSFAQRASLFGDVIPEALTKKDSFTTAGEAARLEDLSAAAAAAGIGAAPHSKDCMCQQKYWAAGAST